MFKQKDKQAHFFAMLSATLAGALFNVQWWLLLPLLLVVALAWEYKDFKLKQKDYGELRGMVKYDWADFFAFAAGIAMGGAIDLIRTLI